MLFFVDVSFARFFVVAGSLLATIGVLIGLFVYLAGVFFMWLGLSLLRRDAGRELAEWVAAAALAMAVFEVAFRYLQISLLPPNWSPPGFTIELLLGVIALMGGWALQLYSANLLKTKAGGLEFEALERAVEVYRWGSILSIFIVGLYIVSISYLAIAIITFIELLQELPPPPPEPEMRYNSRQPLVDFSEPKQLPSYICQDFERALKLVEQFRDYVKAVGRGPLTREKLREIRQLLGRGFLSELHGNLSALKSFAEGRYPDIVQIVDKLLPIVNNLLYEIYDSIPTSSSVIYNLSQLSKSIEYVLRERCLNY